MALNVGGKIISDVGSGLSIADGLRADASERLLASAVAGAVPGFCGYKDISGDDAQYTNAGGGWPINAMLWNYGFDTTARAFYAPVVGTYAFGFSGIVRGGQDDNSASYFGFSKNGVLQGFSAVSQKLGGWECCGISVSMLLQAGDSVRLHINGKPAPVSNAPALNVGAFPHSHHAVWGILLG